MKMRTFGMLVLVFLLLVCSGCGGNNTNDDGNVVTDTGEDIATGAGRTAKDTTQSNVNSIVRDGINDLFGSGRK